MVSAIDYMERVMGYAPHTGSERLRVACALGELPVLTAALAEGDLPFSALLELTRVAKPETEAVWCEASLGKNLRQIEDRLEVERGSHVGLSVDRNARLERGMSHVGSNAARNTNL